MSLMQPMIRALFRFSYLFNLGFIFEMHHLVEVMNFSLNTKVCGGFLWLKICKNKTNIRFLLRGVAPERNPRFNHGKSVLLITHINS